MKKSDCNIAQESLILSKSFWFLFPSWDYHHTHNSKPSSDTIISSCSFCWIHNSTFDSINACIQAFCIWKIWFTFSEKKIIVLLSFCGKFKEVDLRIFIQSCKSRTFTLFVEKKKVVCIWFKTVHRSTVVLPRSSFRYSFQIFFNKFHLFFTHTIIRSWNRALFWNWYTSHFIRFNRDRGKSFQMEYDEIMMRIDTTKNKTGFDTEDIQQNPRMFSNISSDFFLF